MQGASGRSKFRDISGHVGLQVIVMKRSAFPFFLTIAMESWYRFRIARGLPVKVAGSIIALPRV